MGKLRSLEAVRAVAALLVVMFHAQAVFAPRMGRVPFGNLFGAGYRGVDLFFVLSGFIIATVHGGDGGRPARLPGYLFNRLTRIFPAVWIVSVPAIVLLAAGFGRPDEAAKLAPGRLLASLLLLPQHGDSLLDVTWTLTYEMFFYAVFAVTILRRRLGWGLLVLWQAAVAAAALAGLRNGQGGYFLRSICLEFGIGLLAAWWVRHPGSARPPAIWWLLLAAGAAAFVSGMTLGLNPAAELTSALGGAAGIVALVRLEQAGRLAVPAVLVALGGASYAIYLVHGPVLVLAATLAARQRWPLSDPACLFCALLAVLAGLAFDRLVDRPVHAFLRRRKPMLLGRFAAQAAR